MTEKQKVVITGLCTCHTLLSTFPIVNSRLSPLLPVFSFLLQKAEAKELARQDKKAAAEAAKAAREQAAKEVKEAKAATRQVDIPPFD